MRNQLLTCSMWLGVLGSVARTFLANRLGSNRWIPLPKVRPAHRPDVPIAALIAPVDAIVRTVVRNTGHPCLYYSYARCRVLRRHGYDVRLNLGLHTRHGGSFAEGHCWLSMADRVLFEERDPHESFPDMLGERNGVIYWGRLQKDDRRVLREKETA